TGSTEGVLIQGRQADCKPMSARGRQRFRVGEEITTVPPRWAAVSEGSDEQANDSERRCIPDRRRQPAGDRPGAGTENDPHWLFRALVGRLCGGRGGSRGAVQAVGQGRE